jgi:hypothetical protein
VSRPSPHAFSDLEEAPRAGVEPKKLVRRSKTMRILVWTSVLLAPIALLGWITALGAGSSGSDAASGASSPGRAAATEAVRTWLSAEQSPLTGGEIISWDGATIRSTTTDDTTGVTVTVESDRFTVGVRASAATTSTTSAKSTTTTKPKGSGSKTTTTTTTTAASTDDTTTTVFDPSSSVGTLWTETYSVEVLVALDSRGGVEVISAPSMIPTTPPVDDGWAPTDPAWPGLPSANASDAVDAVVQRWADVYVLGSAEDLALATGDPDEEHSYLPLDLADRPDSVTAVAAAAAEAGEDRQVVRVSLVFAWDGVDGEDPLEAPRVDMDLLVERASTASPVVVAWGPAGSGGDLEPYANGVIGERAGATKSTSTTEASTSSTTTTEAGGD